MNLNRRSFLKNAAGILGTAVAILPLGAKIMGSRAYAEDAPKPLSESDQLAKTMGYHKNAAKVDIKKWPKKGAADGKTQTCSSCMFYTSVDKKIGKCQIFPNNTVEAKGWCNSWAKKAS